MSKMKMNSHKLQKTELDKKRKKNKYYSTNKSNVSDILSMYHTTFQFVLFMLVRTDI